MNFSWTDYRLIWLFWIWLFYRNMQLPERENVQTSSCIHFSVYISRQKIYMSYGFFTFWKELIYYLHKFVEFQVTLFFRSRPVRMHYCSFCNQNETDVSFWHIQMPRKSLLCELVVWDPNVQLNNFYTNMCNTSL